MSEPDEDRAVFHIGNLPGHHTNAETIGVVDWPRLPGGAEFMPMSGEFLVRHGDGSLTEHVDGFLLIGADGHPYWQASV